MKTLYKKHIPLYLSVALTFMSMFYGCNTLELDLQDDPNVPGAEAIDPDTNLNFIMFSFSKFFENASEAGAEAVRLEYMFDSYTVNYQSNNANLSTMWASAYADILSEIENIEPILIDTERYDHLGVMKIIRAYTLMTLVDYFGDVPYSGLSTGETFPGPDDSAELYALALGDLNDALFQFSRDRGDGAPSLGTGLGRDLYYDTNIEQWEKLANTLKLKYYLNTRLIDPTEASAQISNLLSENLITNSEDDFKWSAGTSDSPQSKHTYYIEEYEAANTGEYIPNYLAWAMTEEKGVDDPRLRYYIYRQVNAFPTDPETLDIEISCWNDARPSSFAEVDVISPTPLPFCSLFSRGDGYWGRDHGDNAGIPPDNSKRMTFGVYPAGGRFDDNDDTDIASGDGLDGAGIWPIMMNSFVHFMRAEAALYLSTGEDPRALLESGIRASISTVMGQLPDPASFDNIPTTGAIDNYVSAVLDLYDAASSNDAKMAVIGKEYWLAMYGNGVEGYNLYRRTGAPINLQPTLLGISSFPRSFLYPDSSVDRNPNMNQKSGLTEKVFWDNNPDNFIQ